MLFAKISACSENFIIAPSQQDVGCCSHLYSGCFSSTSSKNKIIAPHRSAKNGKYSIFRVTPYKFGVGSEKFWIKLKLGARGRWILSLKLHTWPQYSCKQHGKKKVSTITLSEARLCQPCKHSKKNRFPHSSTAAKKPSLFTISVWQEAWHNGISLQAKGTKTA